MNDEVLIELLQKVRDQVVDDMCDAIAGMAAGYAVLIDQMDAAGLGHRGVLMRLQAATQEPGLPEMHRKTLELLIAEIETGPRIGPRSP